MFVTINSTQSLFDGFVKTQIIYLKNGKYYFCDNFEELNFFSEIWIKLSKQSLYMVMFYCSNLLNLLNAFVAFFNS